MRKKKKWIKKQQNENENRLKGRLCNRAMNKNKEEEEEEKRRTRSSGWRAHSGGPSLRRDTYCPCQ